MGKFIETIKLQAKFNAKAGNGYINGHTIGYHDGTHKRTTTARGIKAEVVTGDNLGTFISAKRVITGGILLGPLGAFGGALPKKNGTRVHVMLERDGENIGWIESGVRELPQMKKLAATINKASGHATQQWEAKVK